VLVRVPNEFYGIDVSTSHSHIDEIESILARMKKCTK